MEQFFVYIQLDDYLRDWFVNEQGGELPVNLARNTNERRILELFLIKQPANAAPVLPAENAIPIVIPSFKFKPPEYYNYLPHKATSALISCIRNRFDCQMFEDLHAFKYIGKKQEDIIYAWMENHNIELSEKNWNAIAKRYQRLRNIYLTNERQKKMTKSTKKCV